MVFGMEMNVSMHKRRRIMIVLRYISHVSFALSGLWLVLFLTTSEQFTLVRWISYVAPWISLWLLLVTVLYLIQRKITFMIVAALLAFAISLPYLSMFFPDRKEVVSGHPVYKVMTYSKMGRNKDIYAVARVVEFEQPDLLFVQEIGGEQAGHLKFLMEEAYQSELNMHIYAPIGAIISRFPLVPQWQRGDHNMAVEVKFPEASVAVWNVHLQKSFTDVTAQYQSVDALANAVSQQKGPVLVAGDFNATMLNYPYIKIRKMLDNTFERTGLGLGFTFPSPNRRLGLITPFMRIDHIFMSQHFGIHNAYVVYDAGGSDHYPVVAMLSFRQETKLSQRKP